MFSPLVGHRFIFYPLKGMQTPHIVHHCQHDTEPLARSESANVIADSGSSVLIYRRSGVNKNGNVVQTFLTNEFNSLGD